MSSSIDVQRQARSSSSSTLHQLINPPANIRRWIVFCLVAWILGVGGSWWWMTTSVERLSLPLSGVKVLLGDLDARLGLDINLELLESTSVSDLTQSESASGQLDLKRQRWAESINRSSSSGKNAAWQVVVTNQLSHTDEEKVIERRQRAATIVIDTRPCSEQQQQNGTARARKCTDGKAGEPYLIGGGGGNSLRRSAKIKNALAVPFPGGRLDGSPEALRAISNTLTALDALVPPPPRSGASSEDYNALFTLPPRAIPSSKRSGNVTLSFVLSNEDASMVTSANRDGDAVVGSVVDWEIEEALEAFLEPHLTPLRALHDFRIESQVLHHAPLKFKPARDEAGQRWIVLDDQMKRFVNQEQWSLDSASSNDPVLRFLLFIPSPAHSPMVLQSGKVNAFTIPQYGGVSILSGAPAGCLLAEDLRTPFGLHFAQQLQLLLGVPTLPSAMVESDDTGLQPPTPWQIAHLQRIRTRDNVRDAKETLLQIEDLVARTKEMRVGKAVQKDVSEAVDALKLIAREASLDRAYLLSSTAARLANRAYFNPTLVGSLYFPDEHKYAVYTPLFAPVAVPLVVAIAKEVGLWLKMRRAKRQRKKET